MFLIEKKYSWLHSNKKNIGKILVLEEFDTLEFFTITLVSKSMNHVQLAISDINWLNKNQILTWWVHKTLEFYFPPLCMLLGKKGTKIRWPVGTICPTSLRAKTESNRGGKCNFASPIATVPARDGLQQLRQSRTQTAYGGQREYVVGVSLRPTLASKPSPTSI
jgi:hypothetical protein